MNYEGYAHRERRGYRADSPRSHQSIEDISKLARTLLFPNCAPEQGLPSGVELLEAMETCKVKVEGQWYWVKTEVARMPSSVLAEARYLEDESSFIIRVSEATYEALIENNGRARFSVCHELGHIVLHDAQLIRLSHIPHVQAALQRAAAPEHKVFWDTEWQADSFAASFLVPTDGLKALRSQRGGWLSSSAVSTTFGVSNESATIRISNFCRQESNT